MISIVQGGCGIPYLSRPFFNYIVSVAYTGISDLVTPSSILDFQLRFIIEKVCPTLIVPMFVPGFCLGKSNPPSNYRTHSAHTILIEASESEPHSYH